MRGRARGARSPAPPRRRPRRSAATGRPRAAKQPSAFHRLPMPATCAGRAGRRRSPRVGSSSRSRRRKRGASNSSARMSGPRRGDARVDAGARRRSSARAPGRRTAPTSWPARRSTSQARRGRARQRGRGASTRQLPVMRRCEWITRSSSKRRNRCLPWASTRSTARPASRSGQRSRAKRGCGVLELVRHVTRQHRPDPVGGVVDRVALGHVIEGTREGFSQTENWPMTRRSGRRQPHAVLPARTLHGHGPARRGCARPGDRRRAQAPDRAARARARAGPGDRDGPGRRHRAPAARRPRGGARREPRRRLDRHRGRAAWRGSAAAAPLQPQRPDRVLRRARRGRRGRRAVAAAAAGAGRGGRLEPDRRRPHASRRRARGARRAHRGRPRAVPGLRPGGHLDPSGRPDRRAAAHRRPAVLFVALFRIVQGASRKLRHQALHDALTGLPNRAQLYEPRRGGGPRAITWPRCC